MSSVFASPRPLPLRALRAARRSVATLTACVGLAGVLPLAAQNPGDLDTGFLSAATGFNIYTQFIQQVDGNPYIFVGGNFGGIGFLVASDGEVNAVSSALFTFPDFGLLNGRIIYTAVPEAVLPASGGTEPNILVGGLFGRSGTQINAKQAAQNVLRLTSRGAIDTTFNPGGRGANGYVTSITPLADGGSLVAGAFDEYNGQSHPRIVRLNNQGVPESSSVFNPGLNFDATVLSVAAQTVGNGTAAQPQFIVAGQFSNVNGTAHNKLARLNYDGSVDASFNPSFDNRTTIVVTQPDGKILVGGDFQNVNGRTANHIVRLNYDGTVDTSFVASVTGQPFGFIDPPAVYVIRLLNDGSMYLGGNFTTVNGLVRNYLARVNADGTLDASFDPGKRIINAVQSITVQPQDGKLLVGETLSKKNGNNVQPPSLIRLYGEAPTVTLTASDAAATAGDPSQTGAFTLTRTGADLSGALTVYFSLGGTAKPSRTKARDDGSIKEVVKDYDIAQSGLTLVKAPDGTLLYTTTFPVGVDTLTLPIVPTNKTFKARSRSVILQVASDPTGAEGYSTGTTATVTIFR